ncbi:hypothetical protein DPMN_188783 [Dreissena polymorpha]|uniref:Uncharacterized protein n=1 Tax=Dreissena polymorpha TaxID=45954 RepID=A0A9D4IBN0_DREPO|nr:hypothetical protein DPMN_188783 [Dreissena polymorpha]
METRAARIVIGRHDHQRAVHSVLGWAWQKDSPGLLILFIFAPIFVSITWWENFVPKGDKNSIGLKRIKRQLHNCKTKVYLIVYTWKIAVTIAMVTLIYSVDCADGNSCIETLYDARLNATLQSDTFGKTLIVENVVFGECSRYLPLLVAAVNIAQNIIGTNLLSKFHEDRKINVASRVKNAPSPGSHVFKPTGTIFELVQDIIGINLLTKFHEDRTASRVLTRFYYSHIRKNAPPLGIHTNLLTKFHEDWTINVASRVLTGKNAPPPGGHVFKATKTIFELIQDIIGTNLLTKFHDYRKIKVTSRVLTRFYYSHIRKNAPPPWWPCFSTNQHHF